MLYAKALGRLHNNAVAGDLANVVLDPILIFGCHMGVRGAAIAHVLSQ